MLSNKESSQKPTGYLKKVKRYTPQILSIVLVLLLVFIVYWRDFEILLNEALNSEALSYIILMPFFACYLFYRKREFVKASLVIGKFHQNSRVKYADALVGLSFCLIAFLLYWYGSQTFYPLEYHMFSLPFFVAGLTLILFSFNTLRTLLVPTLFLFFLVPLPSEMMYTIGGVLATFNTQASYTLLKAFGLPVTLSTSYGAPTINLENSGRIIPFAVDLPCSGIYTLIAFTMFATFLAIIVSAPFWKKIAIFPLGFTIFETLNVLRITTIISAAALWGEELAMNIFHTVAGFVLIFAGMILTLFLSDKILRIKFAAKSEAESSCPKCKKDENALGFCFSCGRFLNQQNWIPSKTFLTKAILLLLGISLLSVSVNAPVFAITGEAVEVTSAWENADNILPQIPDYNLTCLGRDRSYEQLAKQDASIMYAYISKNISTPVVYVLIGIADSISNLHNWEVCLITWRTAQGQYPLVKVLDFRDVQMSDNPIIVRYLVFQDNDQNYTQVTLYWYERITFIMGTTIQQKYVRLSLMVVLTENQAEYQQYEDFLLNFGQKIISHLEPLKTQSLISLGVPAQQTLLVVSTMFIAITKTTQHANEWRKRTNNLKIFTNFATLEDRLVLQAVNKLNKEKKPATVRNINWALKAKNGKSLKIEELMEKLNRLQDYGFIKSALTSVGSKPFLVWKSLIRVETLNER